MKKISLKAKFRMTILVLGLIISNVFFVFFIFSYTSKIKDTKDEIERLKVAYDDKLNEEEVLKEKINKLQDPEYMAKYAREKYLYSKDDEIVIKIDD